MVPERGSNANMVPRRNRGPRPLLWSSLLPSIEAGKSYHRLHTERRTGMYNIVRYQVVTDVMQWDALHPIGMHGPGMAENSHFYGMFWDA